MDKKTKTYTGVVVSDKMHKSIVVEIRQRKPHPVYKKIIWKRKKVMVHDERNEAKIGQSVEIALCRPLSRRKRFRLLKVLSS